VRLHNRLIGEIGPALHAALERMQLRIVGILTPLKMVAAMPLLAARLATRPPPQAPFLVVFSTGCLAYPSDDGGLLELCEF